MKKVVTILASTLISLTAISQTKTTYTISSFPTYDEYGNYYEVVKEYDHLPTAEDSAKFKVESRQYVNRMIDSVASSYKTTYNRSTSTPNTKSKKSGKVNRHIKRSSR